MVPLTSEGQKIQSAARHSFFIAENRILQTFGFVANHPKPQKPEQSPPKQWSSSAMPCLSLVCMWLQEGRPVGRVERAGAEVQSTFRIQDPESLGPHPPLLTQAGKGKTRKLK